MSTRTVLTASILVLLISMSGCATTALFLDPAHPGMADVAGGHMQLLFSNPEYGDLTDPMVRHEYEQMEVFGRKTGYPFVSGGIGAMEVWHF